LSGLKYKTALTQKVSKVPIRLAVNSITFPQDNKNVSKVQLGYTFGSYNTKKISNSLLGEPVEDYYSENEKLSIRWPP
jgi:hypothetical protein